MGRGSRRSSPPPRASTPPRTAPPPSTRSAHPHPPAATPAPSFGGGGFMSTMMGAAAGSVIGHGVSNALFGSREQQVAAVDEARTNVNSVCQTQLDLFDKCLEKSKEPSQCQWIYEDLMKCKNSA
eukprot:NODE_10146_length_537_cov_93.695652_g9500_i0.p1 GENE.NODE_10146_length_537_cov_93.695652_g9500_i0~~NODE_10146_length_537_cov_93.695652_g9500_i0.p1  ORF type:complete len:125 (+),score=37.10 NODE_10146_length_537_cov_93.695652_g9500_i0:55-429(+)